MSSNSVYRLNNEVLSNTIKHATKRLLYMAPGVTKSVAIELNNAWERIGIDNVNIILDVDAEIFRLGYGEIEALTMLETKAREKGTLISHQPGVRIGLLIADEEVIVYTPTPLLIEADSKQPDHPNAIRLAALPKNIAKDLGLGPQGIIDQNIGLEKAPSKAIEKVAEELKLNPPMKFNVAKTIMVFNSRFEFVEFELKNCFISRKEVPLKSDLFGLAKGDKAYDSLRSSFKLIGKNSKISEKKLSDKKKKITDRFLIQIKGYGAVILRSKKDEFDKEIIIFKEEIKKFQNEIENKLNQEISQNKKTLIAALLPAVKRKPPERWSKFISYTDKKEKDKEIEELLNNEISDAFGSAKKLVDEMDASIVYKGITYELLNDQKFIDAATKALPTMKSFHWEKPGVLSEKQNSENK
ncbi:hypothetical protein [Hanamia caeni]|nr:hypothetical protein [Hanamia caeni]